MSKKLCKQLERVGHRRQSQSARRRTQRRPAAARGHRSRAHAGPEIILADEPVASLDPVLAHSIMKHLEDINNKDGVTVLCSLHFLDLVHRYADRVVALNEGQLVFEGLPKKSMTKNSKKFTGAMQSGLGENMKIKKLSWKSLRTGLIASGHGLIFAYGFQITKVNLAELRSERSARTAWFVSPGRWPNRICLNTSRRSRSSIHRYM
jgi:ABC-type methionine transport system ATPase subunit